MTPNLARAVEAAGPTTVHAVAGWLELCGVGALAHQRTAGQAPLFGALKGTLLRDENGLDPLLVAAAFTTLTDDDVLRWSTDALAEVTLTLRETPPAWAPLAAALLAELDTAVAEGRRQVAEVKHLREELDDEPDDAA